MILILIQHCFYTGRKKYWSHIHQLITHPSETALHGFPLWPQSCEWLGSFAAGPILTCHSDVQQPSHYTNYLSLTKQIQSSSQMLLKGSIKKSKTFQTVAQFSTFLQLFMQMQNDQMVFYMHITLNNFFSLFLSNTLKNIPVIWLAREARKHYSQL